MPLGYNVVWFEISRYQVGNTTRACTKGIWLYPKTIQRIGKDDAVQAGEIVVVDTEGISALDTDANHDCRFNVVEFGISRFQDLFTRNPAFQRLSLQFDGADRRIRDPAAGLGHAGRQGP